MKRIAFILLILFCSTSLVSFAQEGEVLMEYAKQEGLKPLEAEKVNVDALKSGGSKLYFHARLTSPETLFQLDYHFNEIMPVKIPFGKKIVMVVFNSENSIYRLYDNAGFDALPMQLVVPTPGKHEILYGNNRKTTEIDSSTLIVYSFNNEKDYKGMYGTYYFSKILSEGYYEKVKDKILASFIGYYLFDTMDEVSDFKEYLKSL